MQPSFRTTAIGIEIWLPILVVSSSVLFLVELKKYFIGRTRVFFTIREW
jgi:hypothetical protein